MSSIFIHLRKVHYSVHYFEQINFEKLAKKKNYLVPKLYTGGVNILLWNKLSEVEKKNALSKSWYIYYSFRDATTGKMKRLPNIKGEVNRLKTKTERLTYLTTLKSALELLLEKGFNPYVTNDVDALLNPKSKEAEPKSTKPKKIVIPVVVEVATTIEEPEPCMTIQEAFDFALKIKKNSISANSYKNFELRIRKFRKTLDQSQPITFITKRVLNDYLNSVLENTTARTRNNTRIDFSSLFQVLADNEIVADNLVKKINVLNTSPERNKTYTPEMEKNIYEFLEKNDPILLLYVKFVSYNFLRPVEVCRLKIKDLDIKDQKLYLRTKNKAVKIKIIPQILIDDLPDLSQLNPETYLFTPTGYGQEWEATENNRRDNFTKRFKEVVKDYFNLNKDYGLYSFRHTFITKLYRKMRESHSPFEAKSKLMTITGHTTMIALEKYLRDIDAELPEDYSNFIR